MKEPMPTSLSGDLAPTALGFMNGHLTPGVGDLSRMVTWGLPGLDAKLGYPQPGTLTVITGHAGAGKSSLLRRLALANTVDRERRVRFHSYEHAPGMASALFVAAASGIPIDDFLGIGHSPAQPPLYLPSPVPALRGSISFEDSEPWQGEAVDLVLVDGLHHLAAQRDEPLELQIGKLRALGVRHGCPVVVAVGKQLLDGQALARKPHEDWESAADVVLELSRPESWKVPAEAASSVDITLLRSRTGPAPGLLDTAWGRWDIGTVKALRGDEGESDTRVRRPKQWSDRILAATANVAQLEVAEFVTFDDVSVAIRDELTNVLSGDRTAVLRRLLGEGPVFVDVMESDFDIIVTVEHCTVEVEIADGMEETPEGHHFTANVDVLIDLVREEAPSLRVSRSGDVSGYLDEWAGVTVSEVSSVIW